MSAPRWRQEAGVLYEQRGDRPSAGDRRLGALDLVEDALAAAEARELARQLALDDLGAGMHEAGYYRYRAAQTRARRLLGMEDR